MMVKLMMLIGATLAGLVGWWIGARVGVMTGFIVSTVFSGFGMYFARKWAVSYWS